MNDLDLYLEVISTTTSYSAENISETVKDIES